MNDIPNLSRVFLDTSALLSGLNSPFGASGVILSLFRLGRITLILSPEVVAEAHIAITKKFPLLQSGLLDVLSHGPVMLKLLTQQEIREARAILVSEDTPVLAGAMKARSEFLITLDKKFARAVRGKTNFAVMSPGEFLEWYRGKFPNVA